MALPAPIDTIPAAFCASLRFLFSDIDDTVTTDGLLRPESFEALWALKRSGIEVVMVTGRPAGWCDHIARMWPVAAVIGENGAFYYSYHRRRRRMHRVELISPQEREDGRRRLEAVRRRVLREVPGCAVAADQPFRSTDLAIDYREDVPPLGEEAAERICRIGEEEGASCKVSSIHVNCWYGSYDKVSGLRRYLQDRGAGRQAMEESVYVGDSPNDEPIFGALAHSIAVANVRPFLSGMRSLPRYVTSRAAAAGFAEAVQVILARRGRPRPAPDVPPAR